MGCATDSNENKRSAPEFMMASTRYKKQGSVLILTLMLMLASVIFTTTYLAMINAYMKTDRSQSDGVHAFYIAEAGLNQGVWYLMNTAPDMSTDGSWRTTGYPAEAGLDPSDPQEGSFGGGSYTLWVEDSDGAIRITSRGTYSGVTRTVHELENLDSSGPDILVDAVAGSWGLN